MPDREIKSNSELTTKNGPFSKIILAFVLGGGAAILWRLAMHQTDFLSWVVRYAAVMFALYSLYILIDILPNCGFKTIIQKIIGYPLSFLVEIFKVGSIIYNIIFAVVIVFIVPVIVFFLINKITNGAVIYTKLWNFISFFLTLVLIAYSRKPLIWALRLISLPNSEKNERTYNDSVCLIKKFDFRKIAYILGFIVYFLSTIDKFSGKVIINYPFWVGIKDITLEGLVAFTTIDACISTVAPRLIDQLGKPNN